MKKKLLLFTLILIVVLIISIVFFTKSPQNLLSKFSIFNELYKNTSLTITARKSINSVTIDGKSYGETPLEIEDLEEGEHEIILTRKVTDGSDYTYEPVKIYLDLVTNTETIIDLEIGPRGTLSGYTLYYTPSPSSKESIGYLTVSSDPTDTTVKLTDNNKIEGNIEILELEAKEYTATISARGYESIEIPIIIREGFNLNLDVNLFPIPINLGGGER